MKNNKMETMSIPKLIITMSLPAMTSMIIAALYNVVDSYYVAQISDNALTAVSLAFPIQNLIICFAVGTGVGINSLISRSLGAKDVETAESAAQHGMLLAFLNAVLFILIGIFVTKPFFNAYTSSEEIIQMGTSYTYIITFFATFQFISINTEKIMQGTGNMLMPMCQHIIGTVVNIILDPILIFGLFGIPALGVTGAAIATIIGQAIACIFGLYLLFFKKHTIKMHVGKFKVKGEIIGKIYQVALPSIIMQSISSLTVVCLNAILIGFSELAVSVLGVYYKLQSFVFMPVFGINQGTLPIMGYNYGAKNKKRLLQTYFTSTAIATAIMLTGTIIFSFFGRNLISAFTSTEEMIELGTLAFRTISYCFIFAGVSIVASTLFQAVAKGLYSMVLSIVRQIVALVPFAYVLGKVGGVNYVWYAFPLAEILAMIIVVAMFIYIYKTDFKKLGEENA